MGLDVKGLPAELGLGGASKRKGIDIRQFPLKVAALCRMWTAPEVWVGAGVQRNDGADYKATGHLGEVIENANVIDEIREDEVAT